MAASTAASADRWREVTTDAEGMFSYEITIPAHLPGAVYQIRAIGR